jgi:hypothetical protein
LDFARHQAEERVALSLDLIRSGDVHGKLDDQIALIETAILRMQRSGASEEDIRKVEASLQMVRNEGLKALQTEAITGTAQKTPGKAGVAESKLLVRAKEGLALESARRAIAILTKPGHWAFETYKTSLIKVIETAGKIPDEYKANLAEDTAFFLRVCPSAGGLIAAMLTRGQPQGSFERRFATRGNDPVGAAYEIMGTAALCRRSAPAVATKYAGRSLEIDPIRDRLTFGAKAYLNHSYGAAGQQVPAGRKSVEADAQFLRREKDGSYSEIGIDFKHVKNGETKEQSEALMRQIKAVGKAITQGHYHEFHFVTNGRFSEKVIAAVDKVNELLINHEAQTTEGLVKDGVVSSARVQGAIMAPIVLHHHVTSIHNDPHAAGEVQ